MRNMAFLSMAMLALLCVLSFQSLGQVVTFTEVDDDGKTFPMPNDEKHSVIDINSRVGIKIDKTALAVHLKKFAGNDSVLLNDLKSLNALLDAKDKYMGLLATTLKQYNDATTSTDKKNELEKLDKALDPLKLLFNDLWKTSSFRNRFSAKLKNLGSGNSYEAMFATMAEEYEYLLGTLEERLKEKGVKIMLGAWLATSAKNVPLHLPGFDDYENQERYVVQRWDYMLSEDEKKELEKYDKLSKAILAKEQDIRGQLKALLISATENEGYKCIKGASSDFFSDLTAFPKELADSVKMHQNVVDGYVTFVEELNGKYSGNTLPKDASEFFSQIDADVQALVEKTKKFVGDNKIFVAYYKNKVTGLSAEKQGKLNTLIEKVSECVGKLEQSADLKALQQNIQNLLSGVQLDDAALVFTEKVKQFDFKNLPTQTELLLENAGVRKSGDKLVFKLAVVSKENKEPEVIEARVFNLFMVVPHLRTTVYLAFADHFGSEDDGLTDKKFVPAPSYSILFKGFDKCIRRKNVFYNRFVDPGIGVHFAYLNFDDNAAPELGLGGNISLFRDFFQVGGGYNVGLNVGYWFFGVKFPFLNMTMPVDGNKPVWGGI